MQQTKRLSRPSKGGPTEFNTSEDCGFALGASDIKYTSRDVMLTKKLWERTQKTSHFKTASHAF